MDLRSADRLAELRFGMLVQIDRQPQFSSFDTARQHAAVHQPDALEAVEEFEAILGSDWPGWREGRPLANRFFVRMQASRVVEGARLVNRIRALDGHEDPRLVKSTVRRLLGSDQWNDYAAGDATLSFCAALFVAGHHVAFISEGNAIVPDLRATIQHRPITVEWKGMHSADDQDLGAAFFRCLLQAGVDVDKLEGDLTEIPPHETHAQIASQLRELIAGRIDAVRCGDSILSRREQKQLLFGPPVVSDRDRLIKRLRDGKYTRQLATAKGPTALLVKSTTAFLGITEAGVWDWSLAVLEGLRERPSIGAIAVVEETIAVPSLPRTAGISCRPSPDPGDGMQRAVLLVANAAARFPLTDGELDRLGGPAMVW